MEGKMNWVIQAPGSSVPFAAGKNLNDSASGPRVYGNSPAVQGG